MINNLFTLAFKRKPKRRRHTSDVEKGHLCTSACRGRHALSDDEDFLVHDTDDSDDGGSERVSYK